VWLCYISGIQIEIHYVTRLRAADARLGVVRWRSYCLYTSQANVVELPETDISAQMNTTG